MNGCVNRDGRDLNKNNALTVVDIYFPKKLEINSTFA